MTREEPEKFRFRMQVVACHGDGEGVAQAEETEDAFPEESLSSRTQNADESFSSDSQNTDESSSSESQNNDEMPNDMEDFHS